MKQSSEQKLIITIGISGAGKSTYLKRFPTDIIVSPDMIRAELTDISDQTVNGKAWFIAKKRTIDLLNSGSDVVLDSTMVKSKDRKDFLDSVQKAVHVKFKKVAVIFNVDPEVAKSRIKKDIESGVMRSNVPEYAVDRMYEKFKAGYNSIKSQFDEVIIAS